MELVLNRMTDLILPLSLNECMTIFNTMELSNNQLFIENLYLKLKNDISDITTIIDDQKYSVCPSKIDFEKIENEIINL